jgi:hypothetical protein
MAKPVFQWHGPAATKAIKEEIGKRLEQAADETRDNIQQKLSVPFPPASRARGFPRMRTGRLRAAVESEYDESTQTARIGSNEPRARLVRRWWLSKGLFQMLGRIRDIMERGQI